MCPQEFLLEEQLLNQMIADCWLQRCREDERFIRRNFCSIRINRLSGPCKKSSGNLGTSVQIHSWTLRQFSSPLGLRVHHLGKSG